MRHTNWNDTIVALATAPGVGAIAVIRLSGKDAIEIADALMSGRNLASRQSHTAHVGLLRDGEQVLDEAVVTIFRTPKSYTGENVAEISSHGSPYVAEQIIQACIKRGARLAKPGEFTQRAFLNGKMDLAQAEAVADLIASNTAASRKAAIDSLRGGFSGELAELREKLIAFSALIELELDFSEEDVEFADRKRFNELVDQLQNTTRRLLDSFALGNVVKNGVQVAIIGKPNAGKSTLLNALLNENRAIVSAIAGTTRDTIEEVVNIGGILFRLVDTAGIRSHTTDDIETIGVERAKEKMRQASLVIYLFDVDSMTPEELAVVEVEFRVEQIKYILAGNKSETDRPHWEEKFAGFPSIHFIAAKEQMGIDSLKSALVDKVVGGALQTEATLVTNARHFEALQKLEQSLADIKLGLSARLPGDLLSLDIRHALHWLGEITGEITNEDQLDYIFSKFCIGK